MASTSTAPTPANPSSASSASVKAKPAAPKKSGFDPLRPFRYLFEFTNGTVNGTLDGMANWGRKGAWIGTGIGILAVISGAATGGLGLIAVGWMAGLAGGAIAGGTVGLVTGGVRGMDRQERKEKYADDLMKKARAKSRPGPRVDYRDAHREYRRRNDYMFDRLLQQEREIASDSKTYYQDMVHNSRSHGPRGLW